MDWLQFIPNGAGAILLLHPTILSMPDVAARLAQADWSGTLFNMSPSSHWFPWYAAACGACCALYSLFMMGPKPDVVLYAVLSDDGEIVEIRGKEPRC